MPEKSYVSLEQHVCLVCGQKFDTNSVLFDQHLRPTMEHHTVTGWGLCPEHQKMADDGFVALIEVDPARSTVTGNDMKPENAYRTGNLAHLRRSVFAELFNVPLDNKQSLCFVEPGVIDKLQAMTSDAQPS